MFFVRTVELYFFSNLQSFLFGGTSELVKISKDKKLCFCRNLKPLVTEASLGDCGVSFCYSNF